MKLISATPLCPGIRTLAASARPIILNRIPVRVVSLFFWKCGLVPLARTQKRGSRQSERFLHSYRAGTADRSGFAAQARFTFRSSLRDGVEFVASSSARQLLCAKKTRENEPLRLVLPPQELPVIEPVASGAERVGERSINGQRSLIRRSCCRCALSVLLEVGQMNESEALQRFDIRFFCELDCGVVAPKTARVKCGIGYLRSRFSSGNGEHTKKHTS